MHLYEFMLGKCARVLVREKTRVGLHGCVCTNASHVLGMKERRMCAQSVECKREPVPVDLLLYIKSCASMYIWCFGTYEHTQTNQEHESVAARQGQGTATVATYFELSMLRRVKCER
jgi:hypothetical protein